MTSGFSPAALAAFALFFRPWMRRRLRAVLLAGLPRPLPPDRPLLLASNHVSWWDAFVLWEVQRALRPGSPVYTVMLERELRLRPLLRRIGAIGMDPESPTSVARALRTLERRLRERPDAVVFFFPQGRIWPSHRRPLGFRAGIELFARRLPAPVVLPVGLHQEPLSSPAPTVFASAGEPILPEEGPVDAGRVESAVEEQLDRVLAFVARHGEDAPRAWPGPREPLPEPLRAPAPRGWR